VAQYKKRQWNKQHSVIECLTVTNVTLIDLSFLKTEANELRGYNFVSYEVKAVVKVHNSIMKNSGNYLNIGRSLWTAEVIMLGSKCIKLHNKVQERNLFSFQ
jgi:hypothetical protein